MTVGAAMARKRTVPEDEWVTITVLVSFNGMYAGDRARCVYDDVTKGWERAGLIRVEHDGASEARPGAVESDDQGSFKIGAGDDGPAGDEPGQGFGAGGYGTAAG